MSDIETVKVVVVGDSGVGKTSLVHLICQGEPCTKPSWTIGCALDVLIHEFSEGLPSHRTYCVEFWDVGGSAAHRNTRAVFYGGAHGVILVHDLSNRKTQNNLTAWLSEVLEAVSGGDGGGGGASDSEFDLERLAGAPHQLPVLVVACKPAGLPDQQRSSHASRQAARFAEDCGAQQIVVDCLSAKSLAAGSGNAVKLSRFLDKVIERRCHGRETAGPVYERRRPPGLFAAAAAYSSRDY